MKTKYEGGRCSTCRGSGKLTQMVQGSCPDCHGTKKFKLPEPKRVKCRACKGTGRKRGRGGHSFSCKACNGAGRRLIYIRVDCLRCAAKGVVTYPSRTRPPLVCADCEGTGHTKTTPLANFGEVWEAAVTQSEA